MSNKKELLLELIKAKFEKLNKFETITNSYLKMINDINDDVEKAEKFSEMVDFRQIIVEDINALDQRINLDDELKSLYDSNDEDIVNARSEVTEKVSKLKVQQVKVNETSDNIMELMRAELKNIKEMQRFNEKYLDHGDVLGSTVDFNV